MGSDPTPGIYLSHPLHNPFQFIVEKRAVKTSFQKEDMGAR
jgi:hypothetical protein